MGLFDWILGKLRGPEPKQIGTESRWLPPLETTVTLKATPRHSTLVRSGRHLKESQPFEKLRLDYRVLAWTDSEDSTHAPEGLSILEREEVHIVLVRVSQISRN